MENYKEQLNYGTEESPVFRDRLNITPNTNGYGFNLFDRKEKRNLLYAKSKETCTVGKDLLLTVDLEYFEAFKEKVKDEEFFTNNILVEEGKYGNNYYCVPTITSLYKTALHILKERFEMNFFFEEEIPNTKLDTYEDIENMPESLRKEAKSKLDKYNKNNKEYEERNKEYLLIKKALKDEDGSLAWSIIKNRDYEYEKIEIINPITL